MNLGIPRIFAVGVLAATLFGSSPWAGVASASAPAAAVRSPACDTVLEYLPSQITTPGKLNFFWSFHMNFKAFVKGDQTRPIGCLKFFARNVTTGQVVDFATAGRGIEVTTCMVRGTVAMNSGVQLPNLSKALTRADFAKDSFVQCNLDIYATISPLLRSILMNPKALFAEFDNFSMGTIADVRTAAPVPLVRYEPDGRKCGADAAASNYPANYCEPIGLSSAEASPGQVSAQTEWNLKTIDSPVVINNQIFPAIDGCYFPPAAAPLGLQWWMWIDKTEHSHDWVDTSKPANELNCPGAVNPAAVNFYSGPSVVTIGGSPVARTPAWGSIYEVIVDPGGGHRGPGGV